LEIGPEPALVIQGTERQGGRGLVARVDTEPTNRLSGLDLAEPAAEPPVRPTADPTAVSAHGLMLDGTDRSDEPGAVSSRGRTDPAADWALNELASEMVLMRWQTAARLFEAVVLPAAGSAASVAGQDPQPSDGIGLNPHSAGLMPPTEPPRQRVVLAAGLAAILIAASLHGHGAVVSTHRNRRRESVHRRP
jgi:hypothetical protein